MYFILAFLVLLTASCQEAVKEQDSIPNKGEAEKYNIGQVKQSFNPNKLRKFFDEKSFKAEKRPNIYFVFVDTLRQDFLTPENAPNILAFSKDAVNFKAGISASPSTHPASFSLFYGLPPFQRNDVLSTRPPLLWDRGSPFINILKRNNYNVNLYASLWHYCIDISNDEWFQSFNVLNSTAEPNDFLLWGRRTKDIADFCYKQGFFNDGIEPYVALGLPSREPVVDPKFQKDASWLSKDYILKQIDGSISHFSRIRATRRLALWNSVENDINFNQNFKEWDPAEVDNGVVNDIIQHLKVLPRPRPQPQMNFLYLFGAHNVFSWPKSVPPGSFKVAEPNFEWSPDVPRDIKAMASDGTLSQQDIDLWRLKTRNSYINSVRGVDYQIGRFIKALKDVGEYDNSLIIVLSDHGEHIGNIDEVPKDSFGLEVRHCCTALGVTSNVPIYIKFPGGDNSRAAGHNLISHVDVVPSILDYLNIENFNILADKFFIGKSILRRERKCAVTFDVGGTVFNINDGKQKTFLKINSENTSDGTSFQLTKITDLNDNPIAVPPALLEDPKAAFQHVNALYPECLGEVFNLDLAEARFEKDLETLYQESLRKSEVRSSLALSNKLLKISPDNKDLRWQDGKVLMLALVNNETSSLFGRKGQSLSTSSIHFTTAAPEVKNFCKQRVLKSKPLRNRIGQFLGLKLPISIKLAIEFWVNPTDLIRPCNKTSITQSACSAPTPEEKEQEKSNGWVEEGFPFTGLGYTFDEYFADEANPEKYVGATEFVLNKGSSFTIESVQTIESYCDNGSPL